MGMNRVGDDVSPPLEFSARSSSVGEIDSEKAGIGKPTEPKVTTSATCKRNSPSSWEKELTLMDFLKAELTRGYSLELDEERLAARREKVYTFIKVPGELERLMGYGFFQCADAFLFVFTFLPVRGVIAIYKFLLKVFQTFLHRKLTLSGIKNSLKPADKCDLLKCFILSICVYFFSFIDSSVIYHVIKSQSVIKLYIFFNMLEVGDRLLASFVQDTLDALFLTATELPERKSRMGTLAHTILATISVFGHAVVILLQGTTLSVAINASNRALLTVMMSNNFVELKGAVFKKFDKINLFQIACSDVRERFHLSVLLLIVSIQTMREYHWEESRFWILFPDCLMVMLAEVGVDWLKHCFITRFNEIHPEVYKEYTLSMAYDLVQTKQRRAFSDHSDMVGRRLGFVPLPLAVVLIRIIRPSLKGAWTSNLILIVLGYISVATFRLLNSIILLGKACDLIDHHCQKVSPQHTQHVNPPEPPQGKIQETSDEVLARFRNATSQPTTRSPSPTRDIIPQQEVFGDNICKENQTIRGFFPIAKARAKKSELASGMFRSHSASHTPRPSIVNEVDASLGEAPVPVLPSESPSLLMANSAVSILSVSLNEEMLRANSRHASGDDTTETSRKEAEISPTGKHIRKHSLGSNVVREFAFMADDKKEEASNEGNDEDDTLETTVLEGATFVSDLDETIVAAEGGNTEAIAVENKENVIVEDEKMSSTEEEGVKKRKKGLGWLGIHK